MVKNYCAKHNMKQSEFGEMLGLSKSSFSRFMGAGIETTGKCSNSYNVLNSFFQKQKREDKARFNALLQARQASSAAALVDISSTSSSKPAPTVEPAKGEEVVATGDNVEESVDENPQKKARLNSAE